MIGTDEKCLKSGMQDYVSKPFDVEKIVMIAQRWLAVDAEHSREPFEKSQGGDSNKVESNQRSDNTPTRNDTLIIDWEHLSQFTEGCARTEKDLINVFLEHLHDDMIRMRQSAEQSDVEAWEQAVHKMYGACSNFGASAMAQICDEAQTKVTDETPLLHQISSEIEACYVRLQTSLEQRNNQL